MKCFMCDKATEIHNCGTIALDARPNATVEYLCPLCCEKIERHRVFIRSLRRDFETEKGDAA